MTTLGPEGSQEFVLASILAVRTIRPSIQIKVRYGFVDASGSGFGSSIAFPDGIFYRVGVWGRDAKDSSFNYPELHNLVETLEAEDKAGNVCNSEVLIMTNNSTAEACFTKETQVA